MIAELKLNEAPFNPRFHSLQAESHRLNWAHYRVNTVLGVQSWGNMKLSESNYIWKVTFPDIERECETGMSDHVRWEAEYGDWRALCRAVMSICTSGCQLEGICWCKYQGYVTDMPEHFCLSGTVHLVHFDPSTYASIHPSFFFKIYYFLPFLQFK